jgi:hypothetical protein
MNTLLMDGPEMPALYTVDADLPAKLDESSETVW